MEKFNDKVLHFVTALIDVYKNEEEKESTGLIPLELKRPLARHSSHLISLNY